MTSEKEILAEQLDIAISSVKALADAIKLWCDSKPMEDAANNAIAFEKQGDRTHEKFIQYLFTGGAVHYSKADKLALSDKIDKVMDMAEIAARHLIFIPKSVKVKASCKDNLKKLADVVLNTVELVKKCVVLANEDFDKAKIAAQEVEDMRREARNLEWIVLKDLLSGELDAKTLIVKEIIELFVMVADKAESLADFVDVIAIKYKSIL